MVQFTITMSYSHQLPQAGTVPTVVRKRTDTRNTHNHTLSARLYRVCMIPVPGIPNPGASLTARITEHERSLSTDVLRTACSRGRGGSSSASTQLRATRPSEARQPRAIQGQIPLPQHERWAVGGWDGSSERPNDPR